MPDNILSHINTQLQATVRIFLQNIINYFQTSAMELSCPFAAYFKFFSKFFPRHILEISAIHNGIYFRISYFSKYFKGLFFDGSPFFNIGFYYFFKFGDFTLNFFHFRSRQENKRLQSVLEAYQFIYFRINFAVKQFYLCQHFFCIQLCLFSSLSAYHAKSFCPARLIFHLTL